VPPGAIDRLIERVDVSPEVAIAGPRIVDEQRPGRALDGRPGQSLREAGRKSVQRLDAQGNAAARRWIAREASRERDVEWVTGACLLVRRTDAEAVGLLDERYFLYMEDVDFCAAVRARGRRVLSRRSRRSCIGAGAPARASAAVHVRRGTRATWRSIGSMRRSGLLFLALYQRLDGSRREADLKVRPTSTHRRNAVTGRVGLQPSCRTGVGPAFARAMI
jgi:GT2 family glycosyltransferase